MPKFRFVIMGALWMTAFFLFLDRVNISLAAPYIMDELGLSGIETGLILSAYYWGFTSIGLGATLASVVLIPMWLYEQRVKKEKAEKVAMSEIRTEATQARTA